MAEKLGIGLIGCGSMGRSLGKALLEIEAARIAGVADVDAAVAKSAAEAFAAPGYESAETLLAASEVDAVVIASPGFQHRPLAELAAAHGKHLFIEKPLATTTADCDAIIAAAEQAGVLLMVGQVLRFYPCWWQVLELVRRGELGEPLGIQVTRIGEGFGAEWARSWRQSRAMSGGLLMEVNAHEIDFMCQLGGDVERVYAEAERFGDDPADYPNLYFVSLRFASGAIGLLHSSSIAAMGELSGKVEGSAGTLFYANGMGGGEIRYAKRGGEPTTLHIADVQVEPPVRRELRLFVEAVQRGGPSPIPGAEGRRNVAIAEAAYESARTGQPVRLAG
jgi:predicted dehydrogenase